MNYDHACDSTEDRNPANPIAPGRGHHSRGTAAPPEATLETRFREGVALHRRGALNAAEAVFQEVLRQQPDHFGALYLLGLVALRSSRPARAVELIERAIALNGTVAAMHTNLGTALLALRRFAEALVCFGKAIDLRPDQMEAHYNAGIAQMNLLRPGDAVASFDRAIALAPDHVEAHYHRGTIHLGLQRFEEAAASFARAVALRPDFAAAYNDLGVALIGLTRHEEAIVNFRRATALQPDFAQAHNNLGGALWYRMRIEEAIQSYGTAIALRPDYPEPYNNRGAALADLLQIDDAIADYDTATRLRPDYAEAQWNKANAYLQIGRFDLGWRLYEWRKKVAELAPVRTYDQPSWCGGQSISGKTLFIYPAYGLGDMIQFCRYASLAHAAGARVIMEVQPPLFTLLRDMHPGIEVIPSGETPREFDYHCEAMSLPLAFGTTLDTIPAGPPYIRAGERHRTHWADRLPPKTKTRAGLVWSGNPAFKNDHTRSMSLAICLPLLSANVDWFCLQKEVRTHDATILARGCGLRFFGPDLRDFSDTAALVDLMDLIITIDSSVAHLAGAMGKDVWLLLPYHPDWRWLLDRDDSPWYPSMRLFRQRKPGDWAGVIEQVTIALHSLDRRAR